MSMSMMDSSGSSSTSTRSIFSPAGLRVLVVDDDATWLKILEKMLKKCTYQVTTCNLAREALKLLRERKDGFDIVISDVNMPDMNGFQFLEHVGLEMDLPVIMMSVDGETRRVMKGVQHGACDYLRKPIRMKELRNIWQHVFRKRMHDVSLEDFLMMRSRTQLSDVFGGESVSGKKRSIDDNHSDRLFNDPFSAKRARVVWTVDLHQKFVEAVNQIGLQKVGPKKILDLMGVPWLTRENVASHLQKYRLYLSRLQKENETKAASGGMQQSDLSLNELAGNINNIDVHNTTAQRTTTMQQNIPVNGSCAISGQTTLIHNDEQKISTGNLTEVLSTSRSRDAYEPAKDKSVEIEPSIQVEFSSSAPIQLNQAQKPDYHLEHRFDHIPLPQHHSEIGNTDCSFLHIPGSSREYIHKPIQPTEKPSDGKIISRNIDIGSEAYHTATVDSSAEMENHFADCHVLDPSTSSPWYAQKHIMEHNLFEDLESYNRNMFAGAGSALNLWDEFTAPKLWDEVFHDHSSQGDFFLPNANFGDLESPYYTYQQFITAGPPDYTNQERITDATPQLYSSLKFDSKDHKEQEK